MVNKNINLRNSKAFTIVEVMVAFALAVIVVGAVYRVFFSEVNNIKNALEHISVNESARQFFALFGNDVRNTNWIDFPTPVPRSEVKNLKPIKEGTICVLRRQIMDFSVKPGEGNFLINEKVEYYLKPSNNGGSDLYRKITSSKDKLSSRKSEKKICDGVGEILVFTTIKKDVRVENKILSKTRLIYEPYSIDGTGPYLLHVYATFLRIGNKKNNKENQPIHTIKTCFNVRGKLNGVIP